jgi:hypothetical protein
MVTITLIHTNNLAAFAVRSTYQSGQALRGGAKASSLYMRSYP